MIESLGDWTATVALAAPIAAEQAPGALHLLLQSHLFKAVLPVPIFALLAPVFWLLFRTTWRELDMDAQRARGQLLATGKWDARPAAACMIVAVVLTMQEYYGGGYAYNMWLAPLLERWQKDWLSGIVDTAQYGQLYSHAWWAGARVFGYVVVPLTLWKLLFRNDSLLDMGFRAKGFFRHWWIYSLALAVVIVAMFLVAKQPDFGTYYPFYKLSSRSWFDFAMWEAMYCAQFVALEIFFRGWMLSAFRKSMGSAAIFAMSVPYCMIHYGKPYLEAHGAIAAGIFLGSLAMKTKSIYAGIIVHVTVALSMDVLALYNRGALPTRFFSM